jgi:hypothetical protein
VLKVIPTAHVIVLLSDFEGIPISLMEAMAAGLVPVVTPIRSGIPELVLEGETGFIVENRREAFVAAIRRMRDDPELWNRMSRASREHFEQGFSPETVIEAWRKQIGSRPAAIELPRELRFPVHSVFDSWVDSSMAKGPAKVALLFQKWLWFLWSKLPAGLQVRIRALAKWLMAHDSTKPSKA